MANLSTLSDEELIALYQKDAPEDRSDAFGFMTPFVEGGSNALAKRGIGLIQGGMELTGLDESYPETYAASKRAVDRIRKEGGGGGALGVAGEILADPVTAAFAPVKIGGGLRRQTISPLKFIANA